MNIIRMVDFHVETYRPCRHPVVWSMGTHFGDKGDRP